MDTDNLIASDEPEMHSAGFILRRCREFNGMSLEDAAEATKIGKNYLRALEEDRPQDLPSPAYLKGFLRTYATCLGLQAEDLIQLATQLDGIPGTGQMPATSSVPRSGGFNWQRLILPAALLTALIISSVILSPPSPERLRTSIQTQLQVASQAVRSSTATSPVAVTKQTETMSVAEPPPPMPRDGFMVRMKVNRNSALTVIIDDAASQGYTLNSGDLIAWKAARTIAMDLSDAGSVEIELNGTPLKFDAPSGKSTYIVLDANGIQH